MRLQLIDDNHRTFLNVPLTDEKSVLKYIKLSALCSLFSMPQSTVAWRMANGQDLKTALTTPK